MMTTFKHQPYSLILEPNCFISKADVMYS